MLASCSTRIASNSVSAAALRAEQKRLQQRADKSETEGLQKLRHTRFLQQRLFALEALTFPLSNCSMQQGMLQLAKDFCHNFHQGCHRCEPVTLLQEGTSQPLP